MSSTTRKKRPELDRHGPVRRFEGVFGRSAGGVGSGRDQVNGAGPAGASTIAQGVEAGYRVIEEYLGQGRAFARSAASPRWSQAARAADPQMLAERMLQYASDLGEAWLEYVRVTTGSSFATNPPKNSADMPPDVGGFDIGDRPDAAPAAAPRPRARAAPEGTNGTSRLEVPRISIDIRSKRRAEIAVELKPGSARMELAAHDLRHRDPHVARISGVIIEADPNDHRVTIRLAIPDDQPAGTYSGIVVDTEGNLPQGSLSVIVFEPTEGS